MIFVLVCTCFYFNINKPALCLFGLLLTPIPSSLGNNQFQHYKCHLWVSVTCDMSHCNIHQFTVVVHNPCVCDERITSMSPLWHHHKLETCHFCSTTWPDNQFNNVDRREYSVSRALQKGVFFNCHFTVGNAWYIKFPCQIDALGMI